MGAYQISIQPGHIARHTPRNAGAQGREAAVVDIAQDLLLRELQENGTLASVVIKGGNRLPAPGQHCMPEWGEMN